MTKESSGGRTPDIAFLGSPNPSLVSINPPELHNLGGGRGIPETVIQAERLITAKVEI